MSLPAGTKIVCRTCGNRALYETAVELQSGMQVMAKHFKPIGQPSQAGMPMWCLICRTHWFENGKVYTEEGWKSG